MIDFDELVGVNPTTHLERFKKDKELVKALFTYFKESDGRKRFYAIWHLDHLNQSDKKYLISFKNELVDELEHETTTGTQREILKILKDHNLDEDIHGKLIELCFRLLQSVDCPVAVKMHCMLHLEKACDIYPELSQELVEIIKLQYENSSAGFKSRAKKVLKKFSRM